MNQKQIRKVVEAKMKAKGISWYRLANLSGIDSNSIYRIKRGETRFTLENLQLILWALKLELAIRPIR